MNLNGDFEVQTDNGSDVVVSGEPDFKVNEENQPLDPDNPDVIIHPDPEVTQDEVLAEFGKDLEGIAALESALQDLEYVSDTITDYGGINQEIALATEQCIPGFLSGDRPIGYYTKSISATNLKYAIETINYKKAGTIAAIVAAIIAAFYKLIEWFKEKHLKDALKAVAKKVNETLEKYQEYDKNSAGGKAEDIISDTAEHYEAPASKALAEEMSGLMVDVLSPNSVMVKKFNSLFHENGGVRGFMTLFSNVETALESLTEIAKKQIGSYMMTDAVEADAQVKKMDENLHPILSNELGMIRYEGSSESVGSICANIRITSEQLKHDKKKLSDFKRAIHEIDRLTNSSVCGELVKLGDAYKAFLDHIKPKIEAAAKMIESGKVETEKRVSESPKYKGKQHFVRAINHIQTIISNVGMLIGLMENVLIKTPHQFLHQMERAYNEVKGYHKELVEKQKEKSTPALEAEIEKIEAFLKAFE